MATSAPTWSNLHSIVPWLLSSKFLTSALDKFRFLTSFLSSSAVRPSFQKLIWLFINTLQDKIPSEFMSSQVPLEINHHYILIDLSISWIPSLNWVTLKFTSQNRFIVIHQYCWGWKSESKSWRCFSLQHHYPID